jgi:hypothetical protein
MGPMVRCSGACWFAWLVAGVHIPSQHSRSFLCGGCSVFSRIAGVAGLFYPST